MALGVLGLHHSIDPLVPLRGPVGGVTSPVWDLKKIKVTGGAAAHELWRQPTGAPEALFCLACIYLVLLKSLPSWKRGRHSSAYMCSAHKSCLGCNLLEVILTEWPRSSWLDHVEGFHNTFQVGLFLVWLAH